ncbi:hypothetical protein SAMN05444349_12411 [Bacteroides faecichinchillae]|uniref:Uncharacterized protein n=1 Tax=Bacteroides faecichinchillae TaxID=871325 RepID=A0A1M5CEK5_9BACE|nr:hypothetical protein [Bacteroides faecichinchillae]SHF53204.1 hypothetical protein SAMN05444349_12411 [Bacteroides faecichinchillae]
MIKTVKLSDSSVMKELMENIPVATNGNKGLMPVITEFVPYKRFINLKEGDTISLDYSYGQINITSSSKGFSAIILLSAGHVNIIKQLNYELMTTVKDTVGKVNVYKAEEYKTEIQNKTDHEFLFNISYLGK